MNDKQNTTTTKLQIIVVYVEIHRIKNIDLVNQKFRAEGRIIFGLEATKDDYNTYNSDQKGFMLSEDQINGLFRIIY